MKFLLLLFFLAFTSPSFSQSSFLDKNYQQKFSQFKTSELKHVVVNLESNKNKNFRIDHQSFVIGNDLKNAPEFENKVSYGIKSIGGGIFSLNAVNQKIYGQNNEQNFLGMSYNISSKFTNLNFSYKNVDNSNLQNNLMSLTFQAKF